MTVLTRLPAPFLIGPRSHGPLVRLTPTDVVVSGTFDPATMTFAVDATAAK